MEKAILVGAAILLQALASAADGAATEAPPPSHRREVIYPESTYSPLADRVGAILLEVLSDGDGPSTVQVCSALILTDTTILTARHCFYEVDGSKIKKFASYLSAPYGKEVAIKNLKNDFLVESKELDFVVIEIETKLTEIALLPLKTNSLINKPGSELFIIHFPDLAQKALTRMDCKASAVAPKPALIYHTCDTRPGSSGAPIFNGKFELVGIHQQGGRGDADDSYNIGAKIEDIMGASAAVASALKPVATSVVVLPPSDEEYDIFSISLSKFANVIRRGANWTYTSNGRSYPLAIQNKIDGQLVFWEPIRDILIRFSAAGGAVHSRGMDQNFDWSNLGDAKKVK